MKSLAGISILCLLYSCSFNSTASNREEDKNEAEKLTTKFYESLLVDDYSSVKGMFSDKFFAVTNEDQLNKLFNDSQTFNGKIVNYNLQNWETFVVKGTDAKSEYLFTYKIEREENPTVETISMLKEDGVIKIVGSNIASKY